jgi:hypothetical protein
MTYDELVAKILQTCPSASFGEDNDGQIVVYTNLKEVHNRTWGDSPLVRQEELAEFVAD